MNPIKKLTLGLLITTSFFALNDSAYASVAGSNTAHVSITNNMDFSQLTPEQLANITNADLLKLTPEQLQAYMNALHHAISRTPTLKARLQPKLDQAKEVSRLHTSTSTSTHTRRTTSTISHVATSHNSISHSSVNHTSTSTASKSHNTQVANDLSNNKAQAQAKTLSRYDKAIAKAQTSEYDKKMDALALCMDNGVWNALYEATLKTSTDFTIDQVVSLIPEDHINELEKELAVSYLQNQLIKIAKPNGKIDLTSLKELYNKVENLIDQADEFRESTSGDYLKVFLDNVDEDTLNIYYTANGITADSGKQPTPAGYVEVVKVPVAKAHNVSSSPVKKHYVSYGGSSTSHHRKKVSMNHSHYSHDDHRNRHNHTSHVKKTSSHTSYNYKPYAHTHVKKHKAVSHTHTHINVIHTLSIHQHMKKHKAKHSAKSRK